jgi:hypothetical protein
MGSSSHDSPDNPVSSNQPIVGSSITPVPQSPAPPPWVRYTSFLPSDPSAMASGLTQGMVNNIDKYSLPAYLTPTEVEGGTQERPGTTTTTPSPVTPPVAAAAPAAITRADLGNRPTGQMLALVGQEGTQQNRHLLADYMRRAERQRWSR